MDYRQLDAERQSEMLAQRLLDQGHLFRPMRHANCVASNNRKSRSAGCYSERLQRNAMEQASAATCVRCPYSHFVSQHVAIWKKDAAALLEQPAAKDSLIAQNAQAQARNLLVAIQLVQSRVP